MTKGKELPSYIHRRKRDGVLLFRKRYAGKIVEIRLETQFSEDEPVPFALHQERERLLNAPSPVPSGKDVAAVIRAYRAAPKYRDLKRRTRDDYEKHLPYFEDKLGHLAPRLCDALLLLLPAVRLLLDRRRQQLRRPGPNEF